MGHRPQSVLSQWLQTGSHSGLHCLQLSQLETAQLVAVVPSAALSVTANWPSPSPALNCRGHLHILFYNAHLLLIRSHDLLLLIYTGVSLVDGSVKGQYVTFRDCSECTNYNWYHCHLHVPWLFLVLWQGPCTFLSFHFFWFSFSGLLGWQTPLNGRIFFFFFFFFRFIIIWFRWHQVIYMYLKILKNFISLILQEKPWFVLTTFSSLVKFQLFAQFPVDHLCQPVMSSLILF